MPETYLEYLSRIVALQVLLDNPPIESTPEEIAREVCNSFFEIWVVYKDDKNLQDEFTKIITKHPSLIQKFEDLIQRQIENDKNKDAAIELQKMLNGVRDEIADTNVDDNSESDILDLERSNLAIRIKALRILLGFLGVFLIVFAWSLGINSLILFLLSLAIIVLIFFYLKPN
jgi:hypothetical protein